MAGGSKNFDRDYREARRYRYGFHAQRQPGLSKQREALRLEYKAKRKAYMADYDGIVQCPLEENQENREEYETLLTQWEIDRAPYLAYRKKFGATLAPSQFKANFSNMEKPPFSLQQKKPPEFEPYVENFEGYRTYVRLSLGLPNLYNGELFDLEPKAQYEAIVNVEALFAEGSARHSLYRALGKCRAFQISADSDPAGFESLCAKNLVPTDRSHAMPTTRLAKLIVGESVRIPTVREQHSRPHELVWHWDDSLVNKVASLLQLCSTKSVEPSDVPAWVKNNGGIQASLNFLRRSN